MSLVILAVRCQYCGKSRPPNEIRWIGEGGANRCFQCEERHHKAVLFLQGKGFPPACQECGLDFTKIPGDNPVYVNWKDGIYQVLCRTCRDAYVGKRADLYGSTQFGREKGIS